MINKTIAIVGLGGLGGFVCEYIGRLGFEKIILIDKDKFSKSNINRQLLCTTNTLDTYKTDNYEEKLKLISDSKVINHKEFITLDNLYLLDGADIIIDCLDNISTRLIIEKYASNNNKVIIHGAIGEKTGQVCLCLPSYKMLSKLYKNTSEIKKQTYGYAVSLIASLEVEVLMKYINNDYADLVDKVIYVDLNDLEIKKLKL